MTGPSTAMAADSLPARLGRHWETHHWSRPGDRVVVACSGGTDSLALLHMLRFPLQGLSLRLEVAHFDHRMRPESADEARWLSGLAAAWGLPFHVQRAVEAPGDEGQARELRYGFLEGLIREHGATRVVTAHHEDDQIETVLFRILRGTGVHGLRGIPERRKPGILRPLLRFSRTDLEEYARTNRLNPRSDPTNASLLFARGRMRRELLPLLDAIHPGGREGVLRLARNSARAADALDCLLEPVLAQIVLEDGDDRVVLDRGFLLDREPVVQREVMRRVLGERGGRPSESGTATALQFIRTGSSGGGITLRSGVRISRDFGRLIVEWSTRGVEAREPGTSRSTGEGEPAEDVNQGVEDLLVVPGAEDGEGRFLLEGREFRVRWGAPRGASDGFAALFGSRELTFPLRFRGWIPGDRIRTTGGTKKLKKLFGELRIPVEERHRLPLLLDADGEVLWLPGTTGPPAFQGGGGPAGEPDWEVRVERSDER